MPPTPLYKEEVDTLLDMLEIARRDKEEILERSLDLVSDPSLQLEYIEALGRFLAIKFTVEYYRKNT